jgi:hypothetical protein
MLRWTQLGANNEVATPVNWKNGEGVIIAVNFAEAEIPDRLLPFCYPIRRHATERAGTTARP